MKTTTLNLASFSMAELENAANAYHRLHFNNGGSCEFDQSINDISRAKIKAFKKQNGSCFLFKLNKWKKSDPDFWEYNGQMVYNFDASFMTAHLDETLCDLVKEYNNPEGRLKPKEIWIQIQNIFSRLEEIKGVILSWA